MGKKKPRWEQVFHLFPREREALRTIAHGQKDEQGKPKDRYAVLQELTSIVERMQPPVRKPIRIGLPLELREALLRKRGETGRSITDLLVQAVDEYLLLRASGGKAPEGPDEDGQNRSNSDELDE